MLKIRLKRVGRKNDPSYRVVVVPHTTGPKSGKVVEVVGNYDPRKNVKELKADRIEYWMSQGAKPSDTVHNILVSEKIIDSKKINVLPKKTPIKKEEKEAPASEAKEETPAETPGEAEVTENKEEAPVENSDQDTKEETEKKKEDEAPEEAKAE